MADGLRMCSTALRHAKPHRPPAAVFVLLEAVGLADWPARSARSASAAAISKRVRAAPSRASTSPASARDLMPVLYGCSGLVDVTTIERVLDQQSAGR